MLIKWIIIIYVIESRKPNIEGKFKEIRTFDKNSVDNRELTLSREFSCQLMFSKGGDEICMYNKAYDNHGELTVCYGTVIYKVIKIINI